MSVTISYVTRYPLNAYYKSCSLTNYVTVKINYFLLFEVGRSHTSLQLVGSDLLTLDNGSLAFVLLPYYSSTLLP